MRFTELLRDVLLNTNDYSQETILSILETSADMIDSLHSYKVLWATVADKCARLEKENEALLDELKIYRNTKNDH
jgi:hypothetical protein